MSAPRIISDPKIMTGKPVIEGTRITVELILTRLGEGRSTSDIVEEYPHLSRTDVEAAIAHACKLAAQPNLLKPVDGRIRRHLDLVRLHNSTAAPLSLYAEPIPEAYEIPPGLMVELRDVDATADGGLDVIIHRDSHGPNITIYSCYESAVFISGEPLPSLHLGAFPLASAIADLRELTPELVREIKASTASRALVVAMRKAYLAELSAKEQGIAHQRAAYLQTLLDKWDI